jgi:hypothetical protein
MRGGRDSIAYTWVTTSTLSSNPRHEGPRERLPPCTDRRPGCLLFAENRTVGRSSGDGLSLDT